MALAGALLALAPASAHAQFPAYSKDKFLGCISEFTRPLFNQYFNQVTPENGGKWGVAAGTTRTAAMRWGQLDTAYNYALANNMEFNFHVLLWGNQQPTWMATLPPEEQLAEIKKWYAAVAERYPKIEWLQVVNEPTSGFRRTARCPRTRARTSRPAATTRRRSAVPARRATTGSAPRSGSRASTSRTPS